MTISLPIPFGTRDKLNVGAQSFEIHRLEPRNEGLSHLAKTSFSLRILLETFSAVKTDTSSAQRRHRRPCRWTPNGAQKEIAFMPARVLLQDFTGVPAVVDLAAMREAVQKMGGNPKRIIHSSPPKLVIDHSVQVDSSAAQRVRLESELEFQSNIERYAFSRWGAKSSEIFKRVPPDTGICTR